ncbi:AraC family transcriptional regulator [Niabella ginsengisoli]|uniref:AraC family transcriptional regulator n=1 Tax=Niabella ginsengisoli TaxID=522298 RepID=A0ABS9SK28_9BACT|nr:AraC family transcriptional regulator [Niabella ginsengisoli]MCH5598738.1 AraC family transcriptional regulator [Niabella ginsengisoli]
MKVLQFTIPVAHDKSVISQEDRQPYFYPYLHRHVEVQLTHVIKGSGTFVVGTNIYAFNPGDIFFIGANQPHIFKSSLEYFQSDPEKDTHALTLFFDPLEKLKNLFILPEMKVAKTFIDHHATGFKIPNIYTLVVAEKIKAIHKAKNIDRLFLFFDLLKHLNSINNYLEPLSTGMLDKVSEAEGMRIGRVFDYVMQNYHSDVSLQSVADIAHMTPQAFCRYFKKQTGNTFVGFLNEVRINEACKKLTSTSLESVSTVAYTTGFNSITNFNRVFKSIAGKSPLEYLKDYKKASGIEIEA